MESNSEINQAIIIFLLDFLGEFYIEKIDDNKYRFHCNDHEIDDDLIFEMEIVEFITQN